jgi:hypothetical protein
MQHAGARQRHLRDPAEPLRELEAAAASEDPARQAHGEPLACQALLLDRLRA